MNGYAGREVEQGTMKERTEREIIGVILLLGGFLNFSEMYYSWQNLQNASFQELGPLLDAAPTEAVFGARVLIGLAAIGVGGVLWLSSLFD